MVQSHFNTSALFEGSMIPQMAYTDWSWNVFTFAFPRTSKFSSNRSYATLSPPLLLSPGYVRLSGINYFTEPKHYMVNFVNHFFSGIWPSKRSFSRYGRKMALALASSSTQFSAVCSSGNCKKVQPWFFKVRNYSETSDCLFLHEKKHVKMFLPF